MNILWHSPPIWLQTGYGVQSFHFVNILKALGHDVRIVTNCQLIASPIINYGGIPHYPCGFSALGMESALTVCREWKPDMMVSLLDVWPLPEEYGKMVEMAGAKGWYPYAPVDHDPCPEIVASRLKNSKMPLAMSRFTVKAMSEAAPNVVPWYLPHVVDTLTYKYIKDAPNNFEAGKFVVGMVGMNLSNVDRKGFQPAIRAFAKFEKSHPDALLYLHTNPLKNTNDGGQDLIGLAKSLGTSFARPAPLALEWGVSPTTLASVYNNFDVFLLPSRGEGFGIPLIEAQACGVPVITTDFTATAELGKHGWLIPVASKTWMAAGSWQANPDEDAILNALEEAYEMKRAKPEQWLDKKMEALEFAQEYDVKAVAEKYLVPLLDMVEHEKAPNPMRQVKKHTRKKRK